MSNETTPPPPTRNCAGCNEPNPPHETAAGYCLRCLHKEWVACQNDLQLAVNSAMDTKADLERVQEQNRQLITANAELASKATDAAEQLLIMTNAEDDARRELVRLRLRLDWLDATAVGQVREALIKSNELLHDIRACDDIDGRVARQISENNTAMADAPTPPTPEPSRNTAKLGEPIWDSRNSDEPKTEVASVKPCPHCRSTNNAPDSLKCDDCGRDL
jgi:hypothetical protein